MWTLLFCQIRISLYRNEVKLINLSPAEESFTKCDLALKRLVKPALLNALHNRYQDTSYNGVPEDPQELFRFFNEPKNHAKIVKLIRKNILNEKQLWLLLWNDQPNTTKWDITFICVVIKTFTTLKIK